MRNRKKAQKAASLVMAVMMNDDLDSGARYGGAGRFADGSSFLKTHSLF